jgi:hypothetical protein
MEINNPTNGDRFRGYYYLQIYLFINIQNDSIAECVGVMTESDKSWLDMWDWMLTYMYLLEALVVLQQERKFVHCMW